MAFNPFSWFRKHQKVIFVGLTILVMFVFIGQFGQGDFFTAALNLFGRRGGGELVATLSGKKVHQGDLQEQTRYRRLVNEYMLRHVRPAHDAALKELTKTADESKAGDLVGLDTVVKRADDRLRFWGFIVQNAARSPQFVSLLEQGQERTLLELQNDFRELKIIAARDGVRDNPKHLAELRRTSTILGYHFWLSLSPNRVFAAMSGAIIEDNYFGTWRAGARDSAARTEDELDFVLWQQQADKLGIKLTDDDIKRELINECAGVSPLAAKTGSLASDRTIEDLLRSRRQEREMLTAKDFVKALGEEFRVVMAQALILGSEPGVRAYRGFLDATSSPVLATPDEFLRYVREQRSPMRVQFLTLPVADFSSSVTEKPSAADLRKHFERYAKLEPNPASPFPGFVRPRRISIEYVSGNPEDPYFYKLGGDQLAAETVARNLAFSPTQALGNSMAFGLNRIKKYVEEVSKDYSDERGFWYNRLETPSDWDRRRSAIHLGSILEPGTLGTALGQTLVSAPGGSIFSAVGSLYTTATYYETRVALKFTATQVLAQADAPNALAAVTLLAAGMPQLPSFAKLEPGYIAELRDTATESSLRNILDTITKELADKHKDKTRSADAYLKEMATKHHLSYGAMTKALTIAEMIEAVKRKKEPVLEALRELGVNDRRADGRPRAFADRNQKTRPEDFAFWFYVEQQPGTYTSTPSTARRPKKDEIRYWRNEDLKAEERKFEEIEVEVRQSWMDQQAKRAARKAAEKLEDEINNGKMTPADAERFLKDQQAKMKLGPIFELEDVSPLVPRKEPVPRPQKEYLAYQVPEEKWELMEFPSPDLVKRLQELKRPGDAIVVSDRPEKRYYVAVLMAKKLTTIDEFREIYKQTPKEDTLYQRFSNQQREVFRKAVIEQLRRESGAADKDGVYKLPDSVKHQSTSESMD